MPSTRVETRTGWIDNRHEAVDARRRLDAAPVGEVGAFGIAASDLKIVLHDAPRENWGLGGRAAIDIELGFKVEV